METEQIRDTFEANNFTLVRQTKKVMEFRSLVNSQTVYARTQALATGEVQIVLDPDQAHDWACYRALPGVTIDDPPTRSHNSNMTAFLKEIHKGQKPCPYGDLVKVENSGALLKFLRTFQGKEIAAGR